MKTSNISISLILTILSFNQEKGFGFVTRSSSTYVPTTKFASKTSRYRQHVVMVASSESSEDMEDMSKQEKLKPIILEPCIEAMDPNYSVKGPVGGGEFLISRTGGPTDEELTDENLYRIIERKANDLEVNTLVWKCLGYRFDVDKEEWTSLEVFPKWKDRFPDPPDVIGMKRVYSKDVDGPSLRNNQALVKSIPVDNKKSYLKEYMKPFGFTGYKLAELTPNLTRRAQCINWLLFYREELFGYTVEELKERRRLKQEKAEEERLQRIEEGKEEKEEWKPPVKEVY